MAGSRVDCKVVLLGREFAGKTSLVERYLHDRWLGDTSAYQSTIGAAFGARQINVDETRITLGIWDTAGSERYESMSRIYYRGAAAAVVCYDITNQLSFDRVKFWVEELQKYEEGCRIYLCGTKYDVVEENKRKRQVDYHFVTDFAETLTNDARVFETSARSGYRVHELFEEIAKDFARAKATAASNKDQQDLSTAEHTADLNQAAFDRPVNRTCQC